MAACCATTSGATWRKTRRAATSPSTRSITTRPAAEVFDYHHGVRDLQRKTLRMIGDPRARYREDPVRMLRAVRLAAKLGLRLDPLVQAPIREMAELIDNVPAARLFDEMLKLLFSGHAVECVKRLREDGLHHGLLPLLDVILEQPLGEKFVMLRSPTPTSACAPASGTRRASCSPPCSGTRCWPTGKRARRTARLPMPALYDAMDEVLDTQGEKLAITRAHRRRHQGHLGAAAALREARRPRPVPPDRAAALPRRLGFPAAARRRAAKRRRNSPTGGSHSRRPATPSARKCCKPDTAPKKRRRSRAAEGASRTKKLPPSPQHRLPD